MKHLIIALVCLVLFVPVAQAAQSNSATYFTFSAPVSLPGVTLPAGTYLFEKDVLNPSVTRVFSADRRELYATLLTIPTNRMTPAVEPMVTLAERPANLPPALRAWFYPGETSGREFLYPRNADSRLDARATTRSARAEGDQAIASEIAKQIRQYPLYTIFDDVEGSVQDGVVRLTGKVTMPYKASDIAKRVARVPGVREVDNQIQTLPVSALDDELRVRIARQIYGDPMFWNYAIQVNPPIHIIVEHGRVTLTGAVGSEVERVKAEMVARTMPNVFGVENKLQVETGSES